MDDKASDPIHDFFDIAGNIAARGMGPENHQHIRKTFGHHAQKSPWRVDPFLLQAAPPGAPNIHAVVRARHTIKAGREDQDIKSKILGAGSDAVRRDAFDRGFIDVHQAHIGLVIDLIVAAFQRQAPGTEAVILGDELFRNGGVLHSLADLARHEVTGKRIGVLIGEHISEVTDPNAKARFGIELFPKGFTFFG